MLKSFLCDLNIHGLLKCHYCYLVNLFKSSLSFEMGVWGEQHLRQCLSKRLVELGSEGTRRKDRDLQPQFSFLKHFTQRAKFCSGFCVVFPERVCSRFPKSQCMEHLFMSVWALCSGTRWLTSKKLACSAESWWSGAETRSTNVLWPRTCVTNDTNGKSLLYRPKCFRKMASWTGNLEVERLRKGSFTWGKKRGKKCRGCSFQNVTVFSEILIFHSMYYNILDNLHHQAQSLGVRCIYSL